VEVTHSCTLKNHQTNKACDTHWIVFDGSIDAEHNIPHTIKAKAIFALILTECYFGS